MTFGTRQSINFLLVCIILNEYEGWKILIAVQAGRYLEQEDCNLYANLPSCLQTSPLRPQRCLPAGYTFKVNTLGTSYMPAHAQWAETNRHCPQFVASSGTSVGFCAVRPTSHMTPIKRPFQSLVPILTKQIFISCHDNAFGDSHYFLPAAGEKWYSAPFCACLWRPVSTFRE